MTKNLSKIHSKNYFFILNTLKAGGFLNNMRKLTDVEGNIAFPHIPQKIFYSLKESKAIEWVVHPDRHIMAWWFPKVIELAEMEKTLENLITGD